MLIRTVQIGNLNIDSKLLNNVANFSPHYSSDGAIND